MWLCTWYVVYTWYVVGLLYVDGCTTYHVRHGIEIVTYLLNQPAAEELLNAVRKQRRCQTQYVLKHAKQISGVGAAAIGVAILGL